tara:strand:- start:1460 stop:1627 length:168 start_codon:yes stop_codon:yes gene_type:complete
MKLDKIEITLEQVVSLNQAINLLQRSESDHAEQCCFYLKQLAATMSKSKIIKEGK